MIMSIALLLMFEPCLVCVVLAYGNKPKPGCSKTHQKMYLLYLLSLISIFTVDIKKLLRAPGEASNLTAGCMYFC